MPWFNLRPQLIRAPSTLLIENYCSILSSNLCVIACHDLMPPPLLSKYRHSRPNLARPTTFSGKPFQSVKSYLSNSFNLCYLQRILAMFSPLSAPTFSHPEISFARVSYQFGNRYSSEFSLRLQGNLVNLVVS